MMGHIAYNYIIEWLHIHSNKIGTKITMVTVLRLCVKVTMLWLLYKEMNNTYYACLYLLRNYTKLQYNITTIWRKYGITSEKLRMIFMSFLLL